MKDQQVKNAASETQVKDAERAFKNESQRDLADLRYVLQSAQGRRLMWRLMGHCKVYGSIWEPSARIHYNAGMQDVGHFIMGEVCRAGEQYLFQMMTEAKGE